MLNIPHVTGEPYAPALSFYNEQVANPSISSPALLVGRAVVRILRGELSAAQSDLEEAEAILTHAQCERGTNDMLAAMVVAASLGGGKNVDELWRYVSLLSRLLAFSLDHTSAASQASTLPIQWLRISAPRNFYSMSVLRSLRFLLELLLSFSMDF